MRTARLKFFTAITFIAVISAIIYSSCQKSKNDSCAVTCLNGGVCNNSTCTCPTGFDGLYCQAKTCPNCVNGGVCDSATGLCTCPAGYEGSTCEIISRSKFLGNWQVFEKGSRSLAIQYPLSVTTGNAMNNVTILNFNNYFSSGISATIAGDTILIPQQILQGKIIFGKGYIYASPTYGPYGAISMSYIVIDSATNIANDYGYYPADLSSPSLWNK